MTPEFQNTYGNKKDMYESWGEKLLTPTSYDPKKKRTALKVFLLFLF